MDLLINKYGTYIGGSHERIVLKLPNKSRRGKRIIKEYPIRRLKKIIILRPASISTYAVQLAIEHDVDIVYLGAFGKPIGRIFPSDPKGLAKLRRAQLITSTSDKAFELAKQFVIGKSQNQINYLKYLDTKYKKSFRETIEKMQIFFNSTASISSKKHTREQLFGIEGFIADQYFASLKKLFEFPGRKPRARDKFNSALNYGYGILYNEVEKACLYAGLDPFLGLYHSERYGKPSLVLDPVEEFRVPIVDSAVFPLFFDRKITARKNFVRIEKNEYQLSSEGKRKIVEIVYSHLHKKVVWNKKRHSMQRIIALQIRQLAQKFIANKTDYKPFLFSDFK